MKTEAAYCPSRRPRSRATRASSPATVWTSKTRNTSRLALFRVPGAMRRASHISGPLIPPIRAIATEVHVSLRPRRRQRALTRAPKSIDCPRSREMPRRARQAQKSAAAEAIPVTTTEPIARLAREAAAATPAIDPASAKSSPVHTKDQDKRAPTAEPRPKDATSVANERVSFFLPT